MQNKKDDLYLYFVDKFRVVVHMWMQLRIAADCSGKFSCSWAKYFPMEVVETKMELDREHISDFMQNLARNLTANEW